MEKDGYIVTTLRVHSENRGIFLPLEIYHISNPSDMINRCKSRAGIFFSAFVSVAG